LLIVTLLFLLLLIVGRSIYVLDACCDSCSRFVHVWVLGYFPGVFWFRSTVRCVVRYSLRSQFLRVVLLLGSFLPAPPAPYTVRYALLLGPVGLRLDTTWLPLEFCVTVACSAVRCFALLPVALPGCLLWFWLRRLLFLFVSFCVDSVLDYGLVRVATFALRSLFDILVHSVCFSYVVSFRFGFAGRCVVIPGFTFGSHCAFYSFIRWFAVLICYVPVVVVYWLVIVLPFPSFGCLVSFFRFFTRFYGLLLVAVVRFVC